MDLCASFPLSFDSPRTPWRPHRILGVLCLLLLTTVAPLADCDEVDPVSLIPGDEACAGVFLDGPPMGAYSEEELMAIINGAAIVYIQHGFVSAAFQNYLVQIGDQMECATLSLFNQGTAANAGALYEYLGEGDWDPIPDWTGSGEARVSASAWSIEIQFWEECFFGSIVVLSTADEALTAARCVGETVCASLQDIIPAEGTSWGSVKSVY